jgi:hypothetical protein
LSNHIVSIIGIAISKSWEGQPSAIPTEILQMGNSFQFISIIIINTEISSAFNRMSSIRTPMNTASAGKLSAKQAVTLQTSIAVKSSLLVASKR